MGTDGAPMDGRIASSWRQSTQPALNFDPKATGIRVGSPGAERIITPAEKAAAAEAASKIPVSIPRRGHIYISEIMFAGGGTLPQWIEIANGSPTEQVDLSGWTLTIENALTDTDIAATITLTIPEGTTLHRHGQHEAPATLLVVTEHGRQQH